MLDASAPISYLEKDYPCVISGISRVWEEAKNWGMEKRLGKGETFSFKDEPLTNMFTSRAVRWPVCSTKTTAPRTQILFVVVST